MSYRNLASVDAAQIGKVVGKLKEIELKDTNMNPHQIKKLFIELRESNTLKKLIISSNNISNADPEDLAKVVENVDVLNIASTSLNKDQGNAIFSSLNIGNLKEELVIGLNDFSQINHHIFSTSLTKVAKLVIRSVIVTPDH